MSLLGPMTRRLLTGTVSNLEVVALRIGSTPLPATLNPPDHNGPDIHTIITATLRSSNEEWVIDITGCQYSFRDIVVPFEKYITQNRCTLNEPPTPYINTETTDQDLNDVNTEIGYRRYFATLVPAYVDNSLLQGFDFEFTTKVDDCIQWARMHM
ncbi:hypothetical protein NW762_000142 [Fusarium torreyae]|uniref:Uncharacterized protein n=1 Tax=Fusarium torreyae TaxID=1237075 RepID=A0A9W8SIQ3_9HYPO|nr:hypothetical protein NW762_000142 [Fusarium torreyae]